MSITYNLSLILVEVHGPKTILIERLSIIVDRLIWYLCYWQCKNVPLRCQRQLNRGVGYLNAKALFELGRKAILLMRDLIPLIRHPCESSVIANYSSVFGA
jgi:hypothetical protein